MRRRPPRSTRTDTPFPYTTLFRSCGGNYASSLVAQAEAIRQGCDQVLFLDAAERRWIEELGGMNLFFVFDDGTLATPPLTGTILPGLTRASIRSEHRRVGNELVSTFRSGCSPYHSNTTSNPTLD